MFECATTVCDSRIQILPLLQLLMVSVGIYIYYFVVNVNVVSNVNVYSQTRAHSVLRTAKSLSKQNLIWLYEMWIAIDDIKQNKSLSNAGKHICLNDISLIMSKVNELFVVLNGDKRVRTGVSPPFPPPSAPSTSFLDSRHSNFACKHQIQTFIMAYTTEWSNNNNNAA